MNGGRKGVSEEGNALQCFQHAPVSGQRSCQKCSDGNGCDEWFQYKVCVMMKGRTARVVREGKEGSE